MSESDYECQRKLIKETGLPEQIIDCSLPGSEYDELYKKIAEGHNYIFIGKVSRFCPMKPGSGGGLLLREKDGKYTI